MSNWSSRAFSRYHRSHPGTRAELFHNNSQLAHMEENASRCSAYHAFPPLSTNMQQACLLPDMLITDIFQVVQACLVADILSITDILHVVQYHTDLECYSRLPAGSPLTTLRTIADNSGREQHRQCAVPLQAKGNDKQKDMTASHSHRKGHIPGKEKWNLWE